MDISAFFGVVRRRILVIALAVAVGASCAYFVSKGQDEKFTATSKLLLKGQAPTQSGPQFAPGLPSTAPDREALVTRGAVLAITQRRLARSLGKPEAAKVVKDLTAVSGEDSAVVSLTSTASSGRAAALGANTLAAANIEYRKDQTLRGIDRARAATQRELDKLGQPTGATAGTYSTLQNTLSSLRQQAATTDGFAEIVEAASVPSSPSSPKPGRNALIGGFAGLLLGLALASILEQLDRRVRHSRELGDVFGLPVLAHVPKSRALAEEDGKALEKLPVREAEAFQILRANLHYLNTDQELHSVVVTSTGVGDGKSTVALNLAKADASVGKKVLLIEADVRRPRLARVLGMQSTTGLASYLSDASVQLADVTHSVPVSHRTNGHGAGGNMLDVVVAGQIPENPSELINSDRMRGLIKEAEANYDLVVIDTPPATMVADSIPLMSEATAVVVVGRVGRITSAQADGLREQLERIDAPAYGLVANFAHGGGAKYGYGYYT